MLHLAMKGIGALAALKVFGHWMNIEVAAVVAILSLITQVQTHTKWSLDGYKAKCMLRKLFSHLKDCIELSFF